jgi:ATP phosphoribosyltransferase regulatory subunit
MDTVQRALPEPEVSRRLYLPAECESARGRALRAEGWVTLAGLETGADAATEARRLGCTHALIGDRIVALAD